MPTYNDVFCHHLGRYAHRFKQAAKPFLAKYEITDLLCTKLESNGSIIHFPIMTGTKTESWLSTDIQNNAVRRSFQNALKIPTKMLSTDLQQLVQEKNSTESIAKLYQYHHDVYCQSIYKLSGIWLVSIGTKHKSSLYQFFEIDADLEVLIMALDNLLETQPAIRQHMNVAGEVRPLNITSPIV
ncbi:MAG: hypothetical protein H8E49_00860, partial [Gammaproteobacteria bacterium]|nr:hypothetical protein [Gammaproteobacteria bacterium]